MRAYKFRIYPSNKQVNILNNILNSCRYLYNFMLKYERYIYEKDIRFANKIELNNLIPDMKIINPSFKTIHSQILQNVSDRIIKSFDSFFDRTKNGKIAGYPRFKSMNRYSSFTYPQSGFKFTSNKKLNLSKIGDINIKLHRAIKGTIKTLTIEKTPTNKWFACFSCEVHNDPPLKVGNKIVGMDLGLESFAVLSDKSIIENPRYLKQSLDKLRLKSRQLSKKSKGSSNKNKSRLRLAKLYEKVFNQRMDFLHKLSCRLVNEYDCIVLEDLKPSSMKNKYLQFSINDVSWNKFRQLLTYKAEETGCKLDFVNPKDTSKKCSKCGNLQDMPLSKRQYNCPICGNSISRDFNSSLNILNINGKLSLPTDGTSESNACGDGIAIPSLKQEATSLNI